MTDRLCVRLPVGSLLSGYYLDGSQYITTYQRQLSLPSLWSR